MIIIITAKIFYLNSTSYINQLISLGLELLCFIFFFCSECPTVFMGSIYELHLFQYIILVLNPNRHFFFVSFFIPNWNDYFYFRIEKIGWYEKSKIDFSCSWFYVCLFSEVVDYHETKKNKMAVMVKRRNKILFSIIFGSFLSASKLVKWAFLYLKPKLVCTW